MFLDTLAGGHSPAWDSATDTAFMIDLKQRFANFAEYAGSAGSGACAVRRGKAAVLAAFEDVSRKFDSDGADVQPAELTIFTRYQWLLDAAQQKKATKWLDDICAQAAVETAQAAASSKRRKVTKRTANTDAGVGVLFK